MKLKSIEIYGFKSFADKVKIELADGITGIVGPNGCGKSNVVDAVRWVLGEQSAKSLRGQKMSDIIFQGSADRKPMNLAEVTLYLTDCEDLGLGYRDLELKRRAHRNGSSEFFINKRSIRLKDVNHLFLDTGIGKNAFSIFEQGKIDQLIHYTPKERVQLFIEVAGIGKLLNEKKEIEKQCNATKVNYTRIDDLYREQSKGVQKLEKQAKQAKEYKKWNQLNEWLSLFILYRQFHDIDLQINSYQKELKELEIDLKNTKESDTKVKGSLDAVRSQLEALQTELTSYINNLHQIDKERDASIKDLDYLKQAHGKSVDMKAMYKRQLKEIISDQKENTEKHRKSAQTVKEQTKIVTDAQKSLEKQTTLSKKLEEELEAIKTKQNISQKKLYDQKNTLSILEKKIQQDQLEEKTVQVQIEQAQSALDMVVIQMKEVKEDLKVISKQSESLNKDISKSKHEYKTLSIEFEKSKSLYEQLQQDEKKKYKALEEKKARVRALEKLNKEGVGLQKGVQIVLKEVSKNESPFYSKVRLLTDILILPEEDQSPLIPFLKMYQSTLVVDCYETVADLLSWASQQQLQGLSIVCLESMHLKMENLNVQELFKSLFSHIGNAQTFSQAWKLWSKKAGEYLSEDGYLIDLKGVLFLPGSTEGSLFQRQIDLKKTLEHIAQEELELDTIKNEVQKTEANLKAQQAILIDQDQSIRKLEMRLLELSMKKQSADTQLEKISRMDKDKTKQIQDRREILSKLEKNLKQRVDEVTELEKQAVKIEKEHQDLQVQLDNHYGKFKQHLSGCQSAESDLFEKRGVLRQLQSTLDDAIKTADQLEKKKLYITKQSLEVEKATEDSEKKKHELKKQIDLLTGVQKEKLQAKKNIEVQVDDLKKNSKELEGQYQNLNIAFVKKQDGVRSVQSHIESLNESKENIQQSLQLQHELSVKDLEEDIAESIDEHIELLESLLNFKEDIQKIEMNDFQPLLHKLRTQIGSFQDVNLASIKDYDKSKESLDKVEVNLKDIKDSLDALEEASQKIELQSQSTFEQTFNQVREAFIENISILFNGGSADLTCSGAGSFAELGVDIFVEPPGKKMKSIHLLSGGEKCMTAIALLFAFFRVKPSPFCILDEMDAPLDDSNIERFMKMLKQFLGQCQFIIVTHNKRTMAESDAIFGVSMMQKGISKLLSMRFDKSEHQVGIS